MTAIEWTDETDNIIVVMGADGKPDGWWCRKCSEGCDNCYSARLNQSDYFGGNHLPYSGAAPKLILRREILNRWPRQRKQRRHFVASMTDVFGEWVPKEWCFEFLDAMAAAPLQTFQVLTKRSRRMREVVTEWLDQHPFIGVVPGNIWLGVSVENQKWADIRIPDLLSIPAEVRFLSCEPLIGAVDLTKIARPEHFHCQPHGWEAWLGRNLHWIIVGGESGPNARPMHPDWARVLRDQCQTINIAFHFKQWGEWWTPNDRNHLIPGGVKIHTFDEGDPDFKMVFRVGKQRAGRLLDGREWNEFPEVVS